MGTSGYLYAVDSDATSQAMMVRSIASVRAHDREGVIYAACFGQVGPALARAERELGVTILSRPPVERRWRLWLKWKAIESLAGELPERLLVLDNDTFLLADPSALYARYAPIDIAARIDVGCARACVEQIIGDIAYQPGIIWPIMDAVCASVGARALDVINGGIVLFNRGAAEKFAAVVEAMCDLGSLWQTKELPYPSYNGWIQDGVAATVGIGMIEGITFEPLTDAEAPYAIEVIAYGRQASHVLVHTWRAHYEAMVQLYFGERAVAEFQAVLGERAKATAAASIPTLA